MDQAIARRLAELRAEFESGHVKLSRLEVEETYLRERLLMLKGAIAVLEDLMNAPGNGHIDASVAVPQPTE